MAKTIKQVAAEAGESGTKPVKKKAATRKVASKKASTKSAAAERSASTKKAAPQKAVAKKTVHNSAVSAGNAATEPVMHRQISSADRSRMIAEAAYLRGESQGFLSDAHEDWLLAEAEIDNMLMNTDVVVTD